MGTAGGAGPGGGASVGARAIRASAWVTGGYVASQLLRFAGNVVLSRLLFPEVFGLASLVFVFLQGLQMFSDVGTAPAIVQSPRGDDPRFLNTAWTISCARGVLLAIGALLIARPLAAFYGQPLLAQVMPVAGLNAALAGFESTSVQWSQRHLRTERLTVLELLSQAVGVVANVAFALAYRSVFPDDRLGAVWAVVGGSLLAGATRLALTHGWLPGDRNRFAWDPEARRQLFGFGRWVFVSTLLTFLSGQSDRILLGKLVPLGVLGVYGIAVNLSTLATAGIYKVGAMVLFPAYSRMAGQPDLPGAFRRARLPLLLGGAALVSGLIAAGPPTIRLLYDARYHEAGWMLQVLACAAWFQVLEISNSAALLSQGRLPWMAGASAVKLAALVVLLPAGLRHGGFAWALAGLVASDVLKYLVSAVGLAVNGLHGVGQDAALSLLVAGSSAAGILAGSALGAALPGRVAPFVGASAVAGGLWAIAGLWYLRRTRAARAEVGPSPPAAA